MLVGYARTSTADQHAGLEAQERDLKRSGVREGLERDRSPAWPSGTS